MSRQKKIDEDMEEIRKSLSMLSEDLARVAKKQEMLEELMSEVKQLKSLVKEKDAMIDQLERRIDELEQNARGNDLIISGLDIRNRSYSSVAAGKEDISSEEQQSLEYQVMQFFKTKDINIESENVSSCYSLPRKNKQTKPAIVLRFVATKHKRDILKQGKKLKGSDVYINEHLTKKNADIARMARNLRKQMKIQATWTRNGKVIIKLNGTPEEAKIITVRDLRELERFKT